jgi:hypothetical protein
MTPSSSASPSGRPPRLGSGDIAPRIRAHCEVLRSTPRHATRYRLGALALGILALSLGRFDALARTN